MRLSVRRVLALVLVSVALAVLSVAPVFAAGGPSLAGATPAASAVASPGLAAQLWGWVRAIWPEGGCGIDPSGQCGGTAARPGAQAAAPVARRIRPDSGCGIDPDGQCGGTAPRRGVQAAALATPPQPIPASGGVRK